jgi:hypothetical protein
MLEQYGISASEFATAAVMALVVVKVVAITDHFALVNRFPDEPLIYNVAWKTAVYFVVSLVARWVGSGSSRCFSMIRHRQVTTGRPKLSFRTGACASRSNTTQELSSGGI